MAKGKKRQARTVNFIKLWDKILTSKIKQNNSNYGELRPYNMYADILGFYSGEHNVSYIYTLDGYPREIENSFRTTIRGMCKSGVRVSFITLLEKKTIDWNSAEMKSRFRTWQILDQETEDVNEYNYYQNLHLIDSQDWRKDSIVYLSQAELRRKRKMFGCRSMMIISGERGDDFNTTVEDIVTVCNQMNIQISRVLGDIPEYIKSFSPFSLQMEDSVKKQTGSITIPDELLARFNVYEQGIIGTSGQYWGTDIYSSFPCLKEAKLSTESAENWLITAETGGGKSFFVKVLVAQLLANKLYRGTIMDIEGFEYLPLADFLGAATDENGKPLDETVVLNMGEGSGYYYDPVPIILTGDEYLDRDMYSLSASFTLSMFKCMLGDTTEMNEWVDIVINDAVALNYGNYKVDPSDMSTWGNSAKSTIFDVYEVLKTLKSNPDVERALNASLAQSKWEEDRGIGKQLTRNDVNRLITSNEGYQKAIDICLAKLSRYFEENGIKANIFTKRITVEDIKNAKLLICSFGMAGKSPETVDKIQMALMQLYAANMSHLRSIFSKQDGVFNFKLWEEFQRWGGFPDADKTINVALTGGRKLGDINIIITNKVVDMLRDDKFGVFSNITSFAIGAIGDAQVRAELCERLSIPSMLPDLDAIHNNNKQLDRYVMGNGVGQSPYLKAFLIGLDRTAYTVSRMSIPKDWANSPLFRTGITTEKGAL